MPAFKKSMLLIGLVFALLLAACDPQEPTSNDIRVELVVDNSRSVYTYNRSLSVQQFLDDLNIERTALDRIVPPLYTQLTDGMTVTIVRVLQNEECRTEEVSFSEQRIPTSNLAPGSTEIAQAGQNGLRQVCEWITIEDGVEVSRTQRSASPLRDPVNQIIYVGVEDTLDPVPIEGTLVYISGGQAFLIKNSSTLRQPLTIEGGLDGRVFELSPDGRQLLYTRQTPDPNDLPFSNELYVILDINNPIETSLRLQNILTAAWRPNHAYTFTYSTANPVTSSFQGWDAYNDLWQVTIDPQDVTRNRIEVIIPENLSGSFARWGTRFIWSSQGDQLAYAKADGVGLVNLESGEFMPYSSVGIQFPYFNSAINENWVWQPNISWSQDGTWIVTTVHGPPFGGESQIDSIVFNIGIFRPDSTLTLDAAIAQTGIWSNPAYSPSQINEAGFEDFKIAYLQARDWQNSVGTEYDLVVADRDGSNPRKIFPQLTTGLRPRSYRLNSELRFDGEFAWSASGRQIVIVYQGDLWLVEVNTGLAQRITSDGRVSTPRWTK